MAIFPTCHNIYVHQDRPYGGHERRLSKFERIEIIQSPFSGHNRIKLEISRNRILGESRPNTWKLNHGPYQVCRRLTGICLYFSSSLSSPNFFTRMAKI